MAHTRNLRPAGALNRRVVWTRENLRIVGLEPQPPTLTRDEPRPPARVTPAPALPKVPAEQLRRGDEIQYLGRWTSVADVEVLDEDKPGDAGGSAAATTTARVRVQLAGLKVTWFMRGQLVEVRRGR